MSHFLNAAGQDQQLPVSVTMYAEAAAAGQSLQGYLNSKYPTNVEKYGTVFDQLCASEGIFLRDDPKTGLRKTSMKAILEGGEGLGGVRADITTKDQVPTSRIFAPAVLMQAVEDRLAVDLTQTSDAFDSMIAIDDSINGERYDVPKINFQRPEAARSQGITQLALPVNMMLITVSDVQQKIPGYSLGLEISDQALSVTTLDFVALSLTRQAAVEKNERAQQHMLQMLIGDIDTGETSLATQGRVVSSNALDSNATGGTMTQDAWVKWLMRGATKRKTTHIVTDIASAMKIEKRQGRWTVQTDDAKSSRIDTSFTIMNPQWPTNVKVFITLDPAWPANTVMGLDAKYAIRRVRNLSAEYKAIEAYVMRRAQSMRFDFGEHCTRLFEEAFDSLVIS